MASPTPPSWDSLVASFRVTEGQAHTKLSELHHLGIAARRATTPGSSTAPPISLTAARAAAGPASDAFPAPTAPAEEWHAQLKRRDAAIGALVRRMEELLGTMGAMGAAGALAERQRQLLTRFRAVAAELAQERKKRYDVAFGAVSTLALLGVDTAAESDLEGLSGVGLLAAERSAAQDSIKAVSEATATAASSYASLLEQRDIFVSMRQRLGQLTARLPVVDEVIERIRRHERRDTIILAGVIGFCLFLSFLYLRNKHG